MSCVYVPNSEKRVVKRGERDGSQARVWEKHSGALVSRALPIPEAGLPVLGYPASLLSQRAESGCV